MFWLQKSYHDLLTAEQTLRAQRAHVQLMLVALAGKGIPRIYSEPAPGSVLANS